MNKEELIQRLLKADEELSLLVEDKQRIKVVIVGGSALIINNVISRSTMDIDVIGLYQNLAIYNPDARLFNCRVGSLREYILS